MVSWCYWVDPNPPLPSGSFSQGVSRFFGEGFWGTGSFLGWGGRGREEVEDGLMPAPRPPGWSSGVPAAGRWTSSSSPRSTWGRRRGSGQPSARGVCGWPGGPVSGSRSPGAEPPGSEAGPANDKEPSETGEGNGAAAADRHQRKTESNWERWMKEGEKRVSRRQMYKMMRTNKTDFKKKRMWQVKW